MTKSLGQNYTLFGIKTKCNFAPQMSHFAHKISNVFRGEVISPDPRLTSPQFDLPLSNLPRSIHGVITIRAQLLLTWPSSAVPVECRFRVAVPPFNTLFLSSLQECNHESVLSENMTTNHSYSAKKLSVMMYSCMHGQAPQ